MLTAQELADRLASPKKCAIATFAQNCDPEYFPPLRELVFGTTVGRDRGLTILKELGISIGYRTLSRHRTIGCEACTSWAYENLPT